MMKVVFNCVPVLLLVTACGGDDGDPTPETAQTAETGTTDPPIKGDNEWGELCGPGLPDCPADHNCAVPPLPAGSTTEGYCSPNCTVDTDCTDGFVGPGDASCFIPPSCLISCDMAYGDGQCPEGLTCLPTGGPTNACGVEAQ